MGRQNSNKTLLSVRSGAVILSWIFVASLVRPESSYALSVDPVVDDVISVTKLAEPENNRVIGESRAVGPSADRSPANVMVNPSSNSFTSSMVNNATESSAVIVAEPMTGLSPIEPYIVQRNVALVRPSITLSTSSNVAKIAGMDSPSALQASSHGWKIFNIAWYWWLVILVGGVYIIRRFVYQTRRYESDNVIVS